jgi:hypothetical protein
VVLFPDVIPLINSVFMGRLANHEIGCLPQRPYWSSSRFATHNPNLAADDGVAAAMGLRLGLQSELVRSRAGICHLGWRHRLSRALAENIDADKEEQPGCCAKATPAELKNTMAAASEKGPGGLQFRFLWSLAASARLHPR